MRQLSLSLLAFAFLIALTNCGGSSNPTPVTSPPALTLQLTPQTVSVLQDGTPAAVTITASCQSSVVPHIGVLGVPNGVRALITDPTCSKPGSVIFSVNDVNTARATSYTVSVQATSSAAPPVATSPLTLNVVAQATVSQTPLSGSTAFLSTPFQLADWSYSWLHDRPAALTP